MNMLPDPLLQHIGSMLTPQQETESGSPAAEDVRWLVEVEESLQFPQQASAQDEDNAASLGKRTKAHRKLMEFVTDRAFFSKGLSKATEAEHRAFENAVQQDIWGSGAAVDLPNWVAAQIEVEKKLQAQHATVLRGARPQSSRLLGHAALKYGTILSPGLWQHFSQYLATAPKQSFVDSPANASDSGSGNPFIALQTEIAPLCVSDPARFFHGLLFADAPLPEDRKVEDTDFRSTSLAKRLFSGNYFDPEKEATPFVPRSLRASLSRFKRKKAEALKIDSRSDVTYNRFFNPEKSKSRKAIDKALMEVFNDISKVTARAADSLQVLGATLQHLERRLIAVADQASTNGNASSRKSEGGSRPRSVFAPAISAATLVAVNAETREDGERPAQVVQKMAGVSAAVESGPADVASRFVRDTVQHGVAEVVRSKLQVRALRALEELKRKLQFWYFYNHFVFSQLNVFQELVAGTEHFGAGFWTQHAAHYGSQQSMFERHECINHNMKWIRGTRNKIYHDLVHTLSTGRACRDFTDGTSLDITPSRSTGGNEGGDDLKKFFTGRKVELEMKSASLAQTLAELGVLDGSRSDLEKLFYVIPKPVDRLANAYSWNYTYQLR